MKRFLVYVFLFAGFSLLLFSNEFDNSQIISDDSLINEHIYSESNSKMNNLGGILIVTDVNKKNRAMVGAIFILSILLVLKSLQCLKSQRKNKKIVKELQNANKELVKYKDELLVLNKRLASQKKGLQSTIIKLEGAKKQLIQSEKMAGLGVMAAGISHEINNPLNFINGGLFLFDNIRDKIESDPEIAGDFQKSYSMIEEGLVQVNSVIKAMNHFAEIKGQNTEKVNLNDIVEEAIQSLSYKQSSDLKIIKKLSDIPQYLCDKNKVKQIFVHIISNAIDASKDVVDINEKVIEIFTYTSKIEKVNYVTVRVSNNGRAINHNDMGKVFDPFFTTKDPYKGYGLGLSIAYNLMKELDGKILVNNTKSGVEFVTLFPITFPLKLRDASE